MFTLVSLAPPAVHHVLGGGQSDDEEVQDDEEPGRLVRGLGEKSQLVALGEQRGVTGENNSYFCGFYVFVVHSAVQHLVN